MLLDWGMPVKKSWIMNRDNIEVRTDFELELKNIIKQTYIEKLVLNVQDRNGRRVLVEEKDRKLVLPQEFKTLIGLNRKFEFLGWWGGSSDTWHLDRPLEEIEEVEDNMVLLRRI